MVEPVLLCQSFHLGLMAVTLFCKEMEMWNILRVLKMNLWYILLYVGCCLEQVVTWYCHSPGLLGMRVGEESDSSG